MFDIAFTELLLVAVLGLLIVGPARLPETLRTLGLWIGRIRRAFTNVVSEIENEIGMDEVRRQLHNEAVMEEMKRIEDQVKSTVNEAQDSMSIQPPNMTAPEMPPEASTIGDHSEAEGVSADTVDPPAKPQENV